jgi:hypothetical protein
MISSASASAGTPSRAARRSAEKKHKLEQGKLFMESLEMLMAMLMRKTRDTKHIFPFKDSAIVDFYDAQLV